MSDELELLVPLKSKEVSTNSSISQNTPKKESDSLFDKILSEAKANVKEIKEEVKTEKKVDNEVKENKTKGEVKTTSLMDRLVQEAKANVKEIKEEIKTEKKEENEIKENKTKGEVKTTSLMDRLVQEAKANVKEIKEEVKTEKKVDNEVKENKTKGEVKTTSLMDRLVQEAKANVKEIKEEIKTEKKEENEIKESKSKGEVKTTSLMDRLVQEAKANVKEIKEEVKTEKKVDNEVKENKTKGEVKTTSLMDRLVQEAKANVKEIKEEIKTEKKEENEIKESKSKGEVKTTSLMDRLVQEAKANVKEIKEEVKTEKKVDNEVKTTILDIKNEVKESKNNVKEIKVSSDENKLEQSVEKNSDLLEKNNKSGKKEIETEKILDTNIKQEKNDGNIVFQNIVRNDFLSNEKPLKKEIDNTKKDEKSDNNLKQNSKEVSKENLDIKISNNEIKNQKVANELSKLNLNSTNEEVNFKKDELLSQKDTLKKTESLIDKILNENKKNITNTDEIKKDSAPLRDLFNASKDSETVLPKTKNELLTSIYISTQKKSINDKNLEIKHEGVEIAKNATSTKNIETSAKVLNLGLEKIEVTIEQPTEQKNENKLSSTFDRLAIFKNNFANSSSQNNSNNPNDQRPKKDTGSFLIQGRTIDDELKDSKLISLSVSPAAAQTIQNRIIGARQQMASMMSDLARVMYENYNPPVTAFRINLNPSALGSIAIVIRNKQRSNSVSISMNATNNSTKETLVDNQSVLKDSLFKSFAGTATSFDLDFGSSENNENSSDNQNMNNQQSNRTIEIASKNDKKEGGITEDSSYNYM